tara:strand:- start:1950 stop:2519 length:570 start_codon:yes stop_codon:yes gene_type:complete
MSEKPILFNTEMVRAILDGRKTQTRRIIKPSFHMEQIDGELFFEDHWGEYLEAKDVSLIRKGDTLWVRETVAFEDGLKHAKQMWAMGQSVEYYFKTDCSPETGWTPSIHMPKCVARIFLKVTNVRIERVQDISLYDAQHEGCPLTDTNNFVISPIVWFQQLWDSINDKRGYGWDKNPWVWVYDFEVVNL